MDPRRYARLKAFGANDRAQKRIAQIMTGEPEVPRLLIDDQTLSAAAVDYLRKSGQDIVLARDIAKEQGGNSIDAFAAAQDAKRVLVTSDIRYTDRQAYDFSATQGIVLLPSQQQTPTRIFADAITHARHDLLSQPKLWPAHVVTYDEKTGRVEQEVMRAGRLRQSTIGKFVTQPQAKNRPAAAPAGKKPSTATVSRALTQHAAKPQQPKAQSAQQDDIKPQVIKVERDGGRRPILKMSFTGKRRDI